MRIFFTLVLGAMLPSMTFGADGQSRPEVRNFLYQGPDGRGYGFYEITSPLYGHRSVIVIANRQFRVPFRITRALLVSGVASILIIGGAVWHRRRHLRLRHANAA